MLLAFLVVFAHTAAAMLLGWLYFRRYAIQRLPIGVFNLWDVALMLGGIILVPYLYLWLPLWLVAGLLGLTALSLLYFVLEPILRSHRLIWLIVLSALGAEVGMVWGGGGQSAAFLAVNNLVQLLAVVGIANIWAQSGMKARDAAILGAVLIGYDFLFTSVLTVMRDLFIRLAGLPFAPLLAWRIAGNGAAQGLDIGLGDLLLAVVFPLVIRKAYGRYAGITALMLNLSALVVLLTLPLAGLLPDIFPAMVVLGPLLGVQYLYWHRRCGPERTTRQYLQSEPLPIKFEMIVEATLPPGDDKTFVVEC